MSENEPLARRPGEHPVDYLFRRGCTVLEVEFDTKHWRAEAVYGDARSDLVRRRTPGEALEELANIAAETPDPGETVAEIINDIGELVAADEDVEVALERNLALIDGRARLLAAMPTAVAQALADYEDAVAIILTPEVVARGRAEISSGGTGPDTPAEDNCGE